MVKLSKRCHCYLKTHRLALTNSVAAMNRSFCEDGKNRIQNYLIANDSILS